MPAISTPPSSRSNVPPRSASHGRVAGGGATRISRLQVAECLRRADVVERPAPGLGEARHEQEHGEQPRDAPQHAIARPMPPTGSRRRARGDESRGRAAHGDDVSSAFDVPRSSVGKSSASSVPSAMPPAPDASTETADMSQMIVPPCRKNTICVAVAISRATIATGLRPRCSARRPPTSEPDEAGEPGRHRAEQARCPGSRSRARPRGTCS